MSAPLPRSGRSAAALRRPTAPDRYVDRVFQPPLKSPPRLCPSSCCPRSESSALRVRATTHPVPRPARLVAPRSWRPPRQPLALLPPARPQPGPAAAPAHSPPWPPSHPPWLQWRAPRRQFPPACARPHALRRPQPPPCPPWPPRLSGLPLPPPRAHQRALCPSPRQWPQWPPLLRLRPYPRWLPLLRPRPCPRRPPLLRPR